MMDGGAETLHGAMWFSNTSPSYEQLSPVRQNRCDIVAAPQQVRGIIISLVYQIHSNKLYILYRIIYLKIFWKR